MQEPDRPVVDGGDSKHSYSSEKGCRNSALIIPAVAAASDTMLCAAEMKEICNEFTSARLTPSEYKNLRTLANATGTRRQTISALIRAAVRRVYIENCEAE